MPTVYLAFSSGLSGAYKGACTPLARICRPRAVESAAQLGLSVVDLQLGSTPQGLIIAEAVRQRDRGLTAAELAAWAAEALSLIHIFLACTLACVCAQLLLLPLEGCRCCHNCAHMFFDPSGVFSCPLPVLPAA